MNGEVPAPLAAVPDQVPLRQRGMVGGWLGAGQTLGIVVGSGIAAAAGGLVAGYVACAAFLVLATVPYLLLRKDTVLDPAHRPGLRLRGFWISPRRFPDFGWAWTTRFLLNLGNAIGVVYLLYFLQDAVRYPDPDGGVFVLTMTRRRGPHWSGWRARCSCTGYARLGD